MPDKAQGDTAVPTKRRKPRRHAQRMQWWERLAPPEWAGTLFWLIASLLFACIAVALAGMFVVWAVLQAQDYPRLNANIGLMLSAMGSAFAALGIGSFVRKTLGRPDR